MWKIHTFPKNILDVTMTPIETPGTPTNLSGGFETSSSPPGSKEPDLELFAATPKDLDSGDRAGEAFSACGERCMVFS